MSETTKTKLDKLEAKATALHTRLARDTEKYNKLIDQLRVLHKARKAAAGEVVQFRKARTSEVQVGVIVGKAYNGSEVTLRVVVGEGFDTHTTTVFEHEVISIGEDANEAEPERGE